MTDLDLPAIKERLEKATSGPWQVVTDLPALAIKSTNRSTIVQTPNQNAWNRFGPANEWDGVNGIDNATLIAHAPTDIAALVERVEELEGKLSAFVEAYDAFLAAEIEFQAAREDGDLADKHRTTVAASDAEQALIVAKTAARSALGRAET